MSILVCRYGLFRDPGGERTGIVFSGWLRYLRAMFSMEREMMEQEAVQNSGGGVREAVHARWSVRAFQDRQVPAALLERILVDAGRAPSQTNMQPWEVAVVQRGARTRLAEKLMAAAATGQQHPDMECYLKPWVEPWKSRRKACAMAMYDALGVSLSDTAFRTDLYMQNFRAFNAPVMLILHMKPHLQEGSLFDCGMFFQNVMLLATEAGLGTCPQACLGYFPDVVRQELGLGDDKILAGMALGYPDREAPVNGYRTDRIPGEEFISWHE